MGKGFLLILFLLFTGSACFGDEGDRRILIDETLQMGLADQFFQEGDYYRAVTEYKRFLFFFPQSDRADEAYLGEARSYFAGKRWDDAIGACEEMIKKKPLSQRRADALLLEGLCYRDKKQYAQARSFFEKVKSDFPGSPQAEEAQWQIALTYLREERWKEAAAELRRIPRESRLYPRGEVMAQGLDRIGEVPQKSPTAAGLLAGVLPGSGHLYVGRYRDAAIAFLLNGAFIWGAWEAFDHKNYAVGGILTFFELGWYSGNIYSAVSSAHKYNRQQKEEYLNRLEKGFSASFSARSFCLNYAF